MTISKSPSIIVPVSLEVCAEELQAFDDLLLGLFCLSDNSEQFLPLALILLCRCLDFLPALKQDLQLGLDALAFVLVFLDLSLELLLFGLELVHAAREVACQLFKGSHGSNI